MNDAYIEANNDIDDVDDGDIQLEESNHWCSSFLPGPKHVRNIIGNELCERFSYYGLRAILTLYFVESLGFSDHMAISLFSYSSSLTYFMPLLGGFVSDVYWGKYKTIIIFSLIYCGGSIFLSTTAIDPQVWGAMVGLFFIAVGTGGLKPCISPFGAEQFPPHDETNIAKFFSAFYFSINLGSIASFIFTPLIRKYFGYAVAFAIPCFLLLVATGIFYSGRKEYTNHPATGSAIMKIFKTMYHALYTNRNTPLSTTTSDWLERASDVSSNQDIRDTRIVLNILWIFATLPSFWACYDQQGSAWTLQANRMKLYGLEPEQFGVVNPILILLLIPLFEKYVYPFISINIGINPTPLRKVGTGMLFTSLAFLSSGFVETIIQNSTEKVSIFLQLPQIILLSIAEILVSITCLEFAFSQAPKKLKGTIMAFFCVTTALGDMFAAIVYPEFGKIFSTSTIFYIFSLISLLNMFIFILISRKYVNVVHGQTLINNELEVFSDVDVLLDDDDSNSFSNVMLPRRNNRDASDGIDSME